MAACTPVRVDHQDFNNSRQVQPSRMVYDPDEELVYIVYSDQWESGESGSIRNHGTYFRTINPATQALGAPVTIREVSAPDRADLASLIRLDDGRLIVLLERYTGLGIECIAYESDDLGLTWSASPATVFSDTGSGCEPVALSTDGTNVWAYGYRTAGGGGGKQFQFNKRSGVDTWGAESTILDYSPTGTVLWELYDINSEFASWCHLSSTTGFYVGRRLIVSGDQIALCAIRTTDGANFSVVVIKDYGSGATAEAITTNPRVCVASTGRIYVGWMEDGDAPAYYQLCMAYSDDDGATWTVIGSPVDVPETLNETRFGFALDGNDRPYFSAMYSEDETFRIYRGPVLPITTAGWELAHSCEYDDSDVTVTAGTSMFIVSTDSGERVMHVFAGIDGSFRGLYLLEDEFSPPGGGPGPSAPTPSPTGSDENNIFVRKVLGPKSGGWSVHTFPVTCFMAWDEGDFDAGREVPILTAGSEVWPQIQDPALVSIINRIHAPDLYSIRVYHFGGGMTQRYDPLFVDIETAHFTLTGPQDTNILRYLYMDYIRAGGPFKLDLYVDGQIVSSWQVPGTEGREETFKSAVNLYGNAGSEAWFRITDESNDPLVIDAITIVYIKKGHRGGNHA